MPRFTTLVLWFITVILCGSLLAASTQPTIQSLSKMPLSFTKNMGQWDDRVLFRANSGGATMWLTKEGVTYQFTRRIDKGGAASKSGVGQNRFGFDAAGLDSRLRGNDMEKDSIEQLVLTAKFLNANPNPEVVAEGQLEYKCNYFIGNDPAKWHTDVPNYEAVTLKDIYPGIDLKYSGDGNGQAAYEFITAPGADIAQVKVAYDGAESTLLDANGKLILKTKWGDMTAAIRSNVNGTGLASPKFTLNSENALGIAAGRQSLAQTNLGTLTLSYSTYLGGSSTDQGYGIAIDGSGNAYVTGCTWSSDFPTLNPYQTYQGNGYADVFVTKLGSSGNGLIYSTYLGGNAPDYGNGIAVDGSGNAYVTGYTESSDFPTLNPYQAACHGCAWYGGDVFVTKLSGSGNSLMYSTYLGGESSEEGKDIAVDSSGSIYTTGWTASPDFPSLNPYQVVQGATGYSDAFVTKLSSSGSSLVYSTYLGGGNADEGCGITVDASGNAYVVGETWSSNFPTLNPYQSTFQGGNYDAFVTKLSNTGDSLIYSTYLGGGKQDYGEDIAVDSGGNAFVAGETYSSNFPTLNPYQTYQGGDDVFVTKLSNSGSSLIYSTHLGGGDEDCGVGIAVDGSGNAYVTGSTSSSDFPTLNPCQADQGSWDVFVTKLSAVGNSLIYSTYLGGSDYDGGYGITVDGSGNAYVAGYTLSSNFPTLNPYQTVQGGGNALATKLSWTPDYICGDADGEGTINIADAVYLIAYIFSHGPAPTQLAAGDADCSGDINIADAVYLIAYIFSHGTQPCAGCK